MVCTGRQQTPVGLLLDQLGKHYTVFRLVTGIQFRTKYTRSALRWASFPVDMLRILRNRLDCKMQPCSFRSVQSILS